MTPGPFQRFLGIDESADPATLLGLPGGPQDRQRIQAALVARLERLHRHPDGQSKEAERVRRRLREAAAMLLAGAADEEDDASPPIRPVSPRQVQAAPSGPVRPSSPRAGGSERPQLTEFDRHVLAILVGSGGWNPASRARLVGLAGSYGITASGLLKVVTALSRYAQSGGPRLDVAQITVDGRRFEPRAPAPVRVDQRATRLSQVGERLSEELAGGDVWSTVRLSAFFGVLTLILGFIVLRAVLRTPEPGPSAESGMQATLEATGPGTHARQDPPGAEDGGAFSSRPARFQPLPTFLGNALPLVATEAADRCADLPAAFDEVARKLSITDDPAESVYRNWEVSIETIATGWVLADESTRAAIDRAITDVLFELADKPSVGDRLLQSLLPPTGRLIDPADVWRGAWQAGTLGSISGSTTLPPAVVARAGDQLAVTVDDSAIEAMDDFTGAAAAWLDQAMSGLVDVLEYDDRAYDAWEMWIAVQRELGDDDRFNAAIMLAARRILETNTDLARPGPSVNVLGRLLLIADFRQSPVVKDALAQWFDAPPARVSDHDLWVLTSLLAQSDAAPWFGEDLVLPDRAGMLFRNRIRDRIADRWPPVREVGERARMAQGRGISVDARLAARWLAVAERAIAQRPARGDEELAAQLLIACRVNEAAALLAGRKPDEATAVIGTIEGVLFQSGTADDPARLSPGTLLQWLRPPGGGVPPNRRGRAVGPDGEWAAAYESARRTAEEKLKWLNALRASEGTDLGPIDAEVFVHEVYLGSPQEVRSLARAILNPIFAAGPNVAREMLDQFPDAPHNEGVSEVIRRLTGRVLPPARSEVWETEARLALLHHALSLHPAADSVVDDFAQFLIESFAERITAQRQDLALSLALRAPQHAAAELAEVWRERAGALVASRPLPDDLSGLQRRRAMRHRLAEGPIQMLVAEQLTVLDYLTYVTVAEQPGLREAAQGVLTESAEARAESGHVLQQAIEAERAVSRMWALRMNVAPSTGAEREQDR
jgi:hypothetical protein